MSNGLSRDDLAQRYFDQLPFPPYPVQEDALLAWFSAEQGVLVCAPTGTGKTLIAEAAAFEALHLGRPMYYTTPLIALTEQKFVELQAAAERWGFRREDVGLVTGTRKVNPEAPVLVVVAEILLNRLLHREAFDFSAVHAVVMDEFHSFSDPERGIVWEFALTLLPASVRLLLLSATIGNAVPFSLWLERCHGRRIELVQSTTRKVPLTFRWIPDQFLADQLELLAAGESATRRTPALVFCFSREECWNIAEELKGRHLLAEGQQKQLATELAQYDWSKGVGPKLKQILQRGVGVHHAGVLPKYKRIVEHLFQKKLLSICVCTETLAAGINLPARSVVLPSLLKGKPGQQKVIEASAAHQMFGRAGRPQFDSEGFVFALPHEDDVRILRWKEKYDQIPEDTKDPQLIKAKKALKKKMPTRSPERQYWNESQFEKLRQAPPGDLVSRGGLPWRLLAYLLELSPDVDRLRTLSRRRLMDAKGLDAAEKELEGRLLTLHAGEYVALSPPPPLAATTATASPEAGSAGPPEPETNAAVTVDAAGTSGTNSVASVSPPAAKPSWLSQQLQAALNQEWKARGIAPPPIVAPVERYRPERAVPTERLSRLLCFRSVNPLWGDFLVQHLGIADPIERLQLWEASLDFPRSLLRAVRVPPPHRMPPGPLATTRVDGVLVARGLIAAGDLYPEFDPDVPFEERKYAPPLAEKLRMLFEADFPEVRDVSLTPVWIAGDLLDFGGDFTKYVSGRDLVKQEGLIFRHVLRLTLLLEEFAALAPPEIPLTDWQAELRDLACRLAEACRAVDPQSTDQMLQQAQRPDLAVLDGFSQERVPLVAVATELTETAVPGSAPGDPADGDDSFGIGLELDSE